MKNILPFLFIIVCCISFSFIFKNNKIKQDAYDNPQEAIDQEIENTKDPALGYVPKERLITALNYTKNLQEKKLRAAISGIFWTERGPNNVGGRTRTIMVDPNDATKKTIWVGSVGGGLWKTTDITVASPTWTNINDFFDNIAISSMDYDSANTQRMYFCTGEGRGNSDGIRGLGVWFSSNGGTNWNPITFTTTSVDFQLCQKIIVTRTGAVLVATNSGIWRTAAPVSAASIFTKATTGSFYVSDIERSKTSARIYASAGKGGATDGKIYYSDNDGVTWTEATNFATTAGLVDRVDIACKGDTVYAICEQDAGNGAQSLLRSTDKAITWTLRTLPTDADGGVTPEFTRTQAWYDLSLEVDPNNANKIFLGGVDLFSSSNGGTSWTQVAHWTGSFGLQYIHADQHEVRFEPGNSSVIYFGNDGGIFRTTNGTAAIPTLTEKNFGATGQKGYNVTQFYACAAANTTNSNYFLAGAQDNGSHKFTTAGINTTTEVTGGDGCFCFIDQTNSANQITTYVYNNVRKSTNSGGSFTALATDNSGRFVNPMDLANGSNILYSARGNNELLRWTNIFTGTLTKTTLSVNLRGSQITHIKISPNSNNRMYVGTNNGGVYRITNFVTGTTPTVDTMYAPWNLGTVSCIEVAKTTSGNDDSIVAVMSNYGISNSVIFSSNGTAATPTWTNLDNSTLPDMPIRWALFNPKKSTQVLLATEIGVWSTAALAGTSTAWAPTNTGLANVRTDMLVVRRSDNVVVAATHGRGLFTSVSLSALPVKWNFVTAIAKNNSSIDVNWQTEWEINNAYFEIEKSIDGKHFTSIAKVNTQGNNHQVFDYTYTDIQPNDGINYYRIKQVDIDNNYTYSAVVNALIETAIFTVKTYPNPATDFIHINLSGITDKQISVQLINSNGAIVYKQNIIAATKTEQVEIPTTGFSNGIYFLKIQSKSTEKIMRVFVKH